MDVVYTWLYYQISSSCPGVNYPILLVRELTKAYQDVWLWPVGELAPVSDCPNKDQRSNVAYISQVRFFLIPWLIGGNPTQTCLWGPHSQVVGRLYQLRPEDIRNPTIQPYSLCHFTYIPVESLIDRVLFGALTRSRLKRNPIKLQVILKCRVAVLTPAVCPKASDLSIRGPLMPGFKFLEFNYHVWLAY